MGPLNAFNPKEIWKMVVIVSSLDFISYVILRWKGTKQLWLTGVIGGLISSTAVSFELQSFLKSTLPFYTLLFWYHTGMAYYELQSSDTFRNNKS